MKIYFMLAYARANADVPLFADLISNLSAEGFDITSGVAESIAVSPEELHLEADLYILKSKSPLWQNIAAVLDAQGARILNPYPACAASINKVRTASYLSAAQIPIPRSWMSGDLARIPEATDVMPLLLKPIIGHGGSGIRLVRDRAELVKSRIDDMLVQELITPVEDELKLYVIGDSVFGVRRHPGSSERDPVVVEPILEEIALRCGRALGLEIYGIDVLISPNGPVVVDVNYFPSFRGVPNVVGPLTEYIRSYFRK